MENTCSPLTVRKKSVVFNHKTSDEVCQVLSTHKYPEDIIENIFRRKHVYYVSHENLCCSHMA